MIVQENLNRLSREPAKDMNPAAVIERADNKKRLEVSHGVACEALTPGAQLECDRLEIVDRFRNVGGGRRSTSEKQVSHHSIYPSIGASNPTYLFQYLYQ